MLAWLDDGGGGGDLVLLSLIAEIQEAFIPYR